MITETFVNLILIYILSFFDATLTAYQFFLLQKKNCYSKNLELNPVAKHLLGKRPGPINLILISFWALGVITIWYRYLPINDFYIGMLFGFLVMVNIQHIYNINKYKKLWNNNKYWGMTKSIMN